MSELDASVHTRAEALVAAHCNGGSLASLTSLTGHSGLTLRAELTGVDDPRYVVLKLCPPGRPALGRHDVIRQARLIAELGRGGAVPVPSVLAIDDVESPAVMLSWEPGEAAEPVLDLAAGARPERTIAARFAGAAAVLARLHAIKPADLDCARTVPPDGPAAELDRWEPTMATVDPELSAGADQLLADLRSCVPDPRPPRIVHGDYRLGNVLCLGDEVTAVVDWEIWSVGDPRVDLGWFRIMCSPDDLPGIATPQAGVPGPDQMLAAYEGAAEDSVGDLRWFDAATRYKMAAIMGNNLKRHRTGRRVDPYQERLVTTIPTLIRRGRELLDA